MKNTIGFNESAEAAIGILNSLIAVGEKHSQRDQIPSLLELQTICREAGCDFPDLNTFARVRDERPALLLCGGDLNMAQDLARQIGYDLTLHSLPEAPLVWIVDHSDTPRLSLRRSDTDRRVTRKVLAAFLQNELKLDDFVFVEEYVKPASSWRFIWVPYPKFLSELLDKASALELIAGHQASVVIADDTPETLQQMLAYLEQRHWKLSREEMESAPRRKEVLAEVATLLDETEEQLELRSVFLWKFVSERLLDKISRSKHAYQSQIEQQEIKQRYLHQLLGQYHKNWTGGLQNMIESHFQQRVAGKTFLPFLDIRQPGPEPQSFIAAAGLPALFTKLEQFVMDRMADFAGGLDGLANRMELHRITLGELSTKWNTRTLAPKLEARLVESNILSSGTEKRSGIMAKVTGKAPAILEQRKNQIAQACREVSSMVGSEYSDWCMNFMNTFEHNVQVQLTAALANQGLPDVDRLRVAMEGFDRLRHHIQHSEETSRTSELVAAQWLRLLSTRRWIPLYHSR